jgi:hypothetical protein
MIPKSFLANHEHDCVPFYLVLCLIQFSSPNLPNKVLHFNITHLGIWVPTCGNVPNGCEDDLDGIPNVIDKGKLLYNHPINEVSFKNKHELVNLISFTREVETHL